MAENAENIENSIYDVALSFAGEDREYVGTVATELKKIGVKVFYDNFETINLWGKDLYIHLQNVYQKQAKFTVIFISQYYAKKLWTNHERKMAQARAFTESSEYILPARFDDTEIEGITLTTGFIDLRKYSPQEFCKIIYEKIVSKTRNSPNLNLFQSDEDSEQAKIEKLSREIIGEWRHPIVYNLEFTIDGKLISKILGWAFAIHSYKIIDSEHITITSLIGSKGTFTVEVDGNVLTYQKIKYTRIKRSS